MLLNCNFEKEVILMGDFNVNWEDRSARKHLKQISDNFPISPTRISHNTGTQQTNQKESQNHLT